MRKQVRNTLSVVRPPDGLGQRPADVDDLELGAPLQLVAQGHRVGDDDLGQHALVDVVDGRAAEDAVGHDGDDLARLVLLDDGRGLGKGAARVGHVVDQDADLVDHVADQHHAADLVGPGALLVDQGEGEVEAVGEGGGALGAAGVGGDHDAVFYGEVFLDPAEDGGLGVEVVDGDVEEALNLSVYGRGGGGQFARALRGDGEGDKKGKRRGGLDIRRMQVHCDDMVAAGGREHVSYQPCAL